MLQESLRQRSGYSSPYICLVTRIRTVSPPQGLSPKLFVYGILPDDASHPYLPRCQPLSWRC
jgi:hypothetical protein